MCHTHVVDGQSSRVVANNAKDVAGENLHGPEQDRCKMGKGSSIHIMQRYTIFSLKRLLRSEING